jgi:hypothetical protein
MPSGVFSGSCSMFACPATNDFFRARIDQMIDLNHPLAVLAYRMPWQKIEASISSLLMEKAVFVKKVVRFFKRQTSSLRVADVLLAG